MLYDLFFVQDWVIYDCMLRTACECEITDVEYDEDGYMYIHLFDPVDEEEVAVYVVDPLTGNATNSFGDKIYLPETGNNDAGTLTVLLAACLLLGIGAGMMICSKKRRQVK